MRRFGLMLLLAACTGEPVDSDSDAPGDEPVEARLQRYLTGTFDSADQAARDAAYYDVRMVLCEAEVPSLGERVLYVEQAQASALDQPYRQRLYLIEAGDAPDTAVSRIFTFVGEANAVGACEQSFKLPDGTGAEEKVGCEVVLTWDGDSFTGGTVGTDCPTELGGDYATSEVTLDEELLVSWDRGFDDGGTQVWGAVGGGYEFVRRTELEPPTP